MSSVAVCSLGQFADPCLTGYSDKGERLVAGIVALSPDRTKVLLIQASNRKNWVIPKGGWETDEPTAAEAAKREAWEEAGIICTDLKDLGHILDERTTKETTAHAPKALYQFFEAQVIKEEDDYPEKAKRGRCWMTYAEARNVLAKRKELMEAVNRSSIVKA